MRDFLQLIGDAFLKLFSAVYKELPEFGTFQEYRDYHTTLPCFESRKRAWVLEKAIGPACSFEQCMFVVNNCGDRRVAKKALKKAEQFIMNYSQCKAAWSMAILLHGVPGSTTVRLAKKGKTFLEKEPKKEASMLDS